MSFIDPQLKTDCISNEIPKYIRKNQIFNKFIVTTLSVALIVEPAVFAQSKSTDSFYDATKKYVSQIGLNKKDTTHAQFYKGIKDQLDAEAAFKYPFWIRNHTGAKLPEIEVIKGKSTTEQENVQVKFKADGKTVTLDLVREDDKIYAVYKGKKIDFATYYFSKTMNKVTGYNFPLVSFQKLASTYQKFPKTAVKYLTALREMAMTLQMNERFYLQMEEGNNIQTPKKKVSLFDILVPSSYSTDANKKCIIGFWPGQLLKSGDCQPTSSDAVCPDESQRASGNTIRCNSDFTGGDSNSCVPPYPPSKVTQSYCNLTDTTPDTILKKMVDDHRPQKDIDEEYNSLKDISRASIETCYNLSGQSADEKLNEIIANPDRYSAVTEQDFTDGFKKTGKSNSEKGKDKNFHNREACATVVKKISTLQKEYKAIPAVEVPPGPVIAAGDNGSGGKNTNFGDAKNCAAVPIPENCSPEEVRAARGGGGTPFAKDGGKKDDKSFFDWDVHGEDLALGGALAAAGVFAGLYFTKDTKKIINTTVTAPPVTNVTNNNAYNYTISCPCIYPNGPGGTCPHPGTQEETSSTRPANGGAQ